jgi:hypothetical protein
VLLTMRGLGFVGGFGTGGERALMATVLLVKSVGVARSMAGRA